MRIQVVENEPIRQVAQLVNGLPDSVGQREPIIVEDHDSTGHKSVPEPGDGILRRLVYVHVDMTQSKFPVLHDMASVFGEYPLEHGDATEAERIRESADHIDTRLMQITHAIVRIRRPRLGDATERVAQEYVGVDVSPLAGLSDQASAATAPYAHFDDVATRQFRD